MKKIIVVQLIVLMLVGCAMLKKEEGINVVLKLERENLHHASILVFNFKEPRYAEGDGKHVGELFHLNLLKSRKFKVVSLYSNSPWSRLGESEEERLMNALEEGRSMDFDYILVGELKESYFGGINKTRVKIKVRIIEVKTKTTIFLAENYEEDIGKDPSYPMDTKLTNKSRDPKIVAERVVKELINKI
jgi:hypothetical protein